MVIKKALLYGKRIIIVTEPREYWWPSGDSPKEARSQWRGQEMLRGLKELYERRAIVPQFKDSIYFIPESLEEIEENWPYSDENYWAEYKRKMFNFNEIYTCKSGVDMSLNDPIINNHIFENLQCNKNDISVRNIWLPQLLTQIMH